MNSESKVKELPPGDPTLTASIVRHLKSRGLFDQLRRDCLGDVDTKPAYLNLTQRVEGYITKFLAMQTWTPDMNKNQVRDIMRREINESGMLSAGMDHLVDQIVNPKIYHVFTPEVEDGVRQYLGLGQAKEPSSSAQTTTDGESASFVPPASLPPPSACLPPPAPLPPPKSELSIDETTQDVPSSCSPKAYTAVLSPEGFSDTSSEPQLMIVTESNERPEEADSSLPEMTESPAGPREASVEPPGEESLQMNILTDPVPVSAEPEKVPDMPTQVTDDKVTKDELRNAEDKKVDCVKKESKDWKHEEKKGDIVKKESKPANKERKDKKYKHSSSHTSRSDSHAKNPLSKTSGSDPSRFTKASKSKTEEGLPRDSRELSKEKSDQAKEKHSSSRERGDSTRDETSRDRVDLPKEEKVRSSSSRASKTKDSKSERRRPDDKHHYHGSSQYHDDGRHHSSKSSRENDTSKDRSDSHRSHGEGRRDRDRSSTKDSPRPHKSSRSSEKRSDASKESRKDKPQENNKRQSVSKPQASEPKESPSSKNTSRDVIKDTFQAFELAAQTVSEEASYEPSQPTSEEVSQKFKQDTMDGTLELVEAKEAEILRFSYVTDKNSGNCEIDLQLVSTVPINEPDINTSSELHAEDCTQLKNVDPAVAETSFLEQPSLDPSQNVPMDTPKATEKKMDEKSSSEKKREKRAASDGYESDGAWSDVTVSSVHTSDLSSYDDRISVSSGEEDYEVSKEKKKISLREIKKITSSSNEDEDRMSKSETEPVPAENSMLGQKLPDIQENCSTPPDSSSILELPTTSSPPPAVIAPSISPANATVVNALVVAKMLPTIDATTAPPATVTATPAESAPEPKMGLRRQRKINPKYASEEFSSIFTEAKRPTGTLDFGAKHAKEKHQEDMTGRVESRKVSHLPPCEEPHEETVESALGYYGDHPFDASGSDRLRRLSRRHSGSELRPRSESTSSKRYESSDLYKPRPVIKCRTRRSRPSTAATLEATEEGNEDQLLAFSDEEPEVKRKKKKRLQVCIGFKRATAPPARRRRI